MIVERDPAKAARKIIDAGEVDYQPGDGTRYELFWLPGGHPSEDPRGIFLRNIGSRVLPYPGNRMSGEVWWIEHGNIPRGSWAALRPLLAALNWTHGSTEYHRDDAKREYEIRSAKGESGLDNADERSDARLGRSVRNHLLAQGGLLPDGYVAVERGLLDRVVEVLERWESRIEGEWGDGTREYFPDPEALPVVAEIRAVRDAMGVIQ
jgi:hypothetical protein